MAGSNTGSRRSLNPGPAEDFSEQLEEGPQAAAQARSTVRRALAAWGMTGLSADAELLASELVANATEHASGTPVSLALHRRQVTVDHVAGIVCEVSDGSPLIPQPRAAGLNDERGRGLAIVAALATRLRNGAR
jgi:anti-sigma regulatory factor (Ser/Thr protein kinase)